MNAPIIQSPKRFIFRTFFLQQEYKYIESRITKLQKFPTILTNTLPKMTTISID